MKDDDYRPISPRGKLLILLLAVATAVTVMWMLLERPGSPTLPRAAATTGCDPALAALCVGGRVDAFVVPPAAASSAGR